MTNADRIRQMTDEEMVDVMSCGQCIYEDEMQFEGSACRTMSCGIGILKWLKQEAPNDQ